MESRKLSICSYFTQNLGNKFRPPLTTGNKQINKQLIAQLHVFTSAHSFLFLIIFVGLINAYGKVRVRMHLSNIKYDSISEGVKCNLLISILKFYTLTNNLPLAVEKSSERIEGNGRYRKKRLIAGLYPEVDSCFYCLNAKYFRKFLQVFSKFWLIYAFIKNKFLTQNFEMSRT